MTRPEITVTSPDIEDAMRALSREGWDKAALPPIRNAIRKSINVVRKNVRAEAKPHRRTGKMAGRVRTRFTPVGVGWRFTGGMRSTGAPTNLIVGGVQPHHIAAGGRVMPIYGGRGAWKSGKGRGVEGFARSAEHRGFAADPFVHRGITKSGPAIGAFLDEAAKVMARELAYRMKGRT